MSFGSPSIMFTNIGSAVYRYEDTSGDGDYNELDERTMFWQSTDLLGPVIAVDPSTLLVVREFTAPAPTISELHDGNGDGTIDPTEAHTWWNGSLPGGGTTGYLARIARAPDGAVYTIDDAVPHSIYRLKDDNGNGDANDPGEVTLVTQVPTGGATTSLAIDGSGDVWFIGNASNTGGSLYRVRGGTAAVVLDTATLATLSIVLSSDRVVASPDGRLLIPATSSGANPVDGAILIAVQDMNNDQTLTADEVTIVWANAQGDYWCTFENVVALDDGSIVARHITGDAIRFVDGNANGDFNDDGETYVSYFVKFAESNGQTPSQPSYIAAAVQ